MTRSLLTEITCGVIAVGLFLGFAVSCITDTLPGEAERQARIQDIYGTTAYEGR